jgi:hypothetical protein
VELFRPSNAFINFSVSSYVFSFEELSVVFLAPYLRLIMIKAPVTAPHVAPLFPIPPPKAFPIFSAVS